MHAPARTLAILLALGLAGCAHRAPGPRGVTIDAPAAAHDTLRHAQGETPPSPARMAALRDTAFVGTAIRRCGARRLLPDQENVRDTLLGLLTQTRGALERGEEERARTLARNARQLAGSLRCP